MRKGSGHRRPVRAGCRLRQPGRTVERPLCRAVFRRRSRYPGSSAHRNPGAVPRGAARRIRRRVLPSGCRLRAGDLRLARLEPNLARLAGGRDRAGRSLLRRALGAYPVAACIPCAIKRYNRRNSWTGEPNPTRLPAGTVRTSRVSQPCPRRKTWHCAGWASR